MDERTLTALVEKAFREAERSILFAFQGGEPTLCGMGFYKKLISLVEEYNTKKIKTGYAIQTNGMLIDEEWARFLHDNGFLVGLSLDGPKDIHDANRINKNGKGTFNEVMKAAKMLRKHDVSYNILTVVTSSAARYAGKIYNFFSRSGFDYLQFIPCLEPFGEHDAKSPFPLTPQRYGSFLTKLFDLYYNDNMNGKFRSIRYFDNLVGIAAGYSPETCDMNGRCTIQFVIEGNGDVFPCDFYCTDDWLLGNINKVSYEELAKTSAAAEFIAMSEVISEKCAACGEYLFCRGGCRRTKEPVINGKLSDQYFCESYRSLFVKNISRISNMARMFIQRNQ